MPPTHDQERFDRLYERHLPKVYAYFRRRVEDPASARDCAADTFLVAWRRLADVPPGDGELPWLYGVARKVLANHQRSQARTGRLIGRLALFGSDPPPDPETVVVRRLEDQELHEALGRLRPSDQELLRLAIWEELPHAAIGEVLECSPHAVDQRLYRSTKRLARELESTGQKPVEGTTPETAPRGGAQ